MSNSRTIRVILYAVLIFLAGAVTGALLTPWLSQESFRPPEPKQLSAHMLKHLHEELHLSDEQLTKIKPLVEKTGADLETIRRETLRKVLDRLAQTNKQISALLTPEQRAQFDKMEAEHRKRIHEHHHFLGPHGPPPPVEP